MGPVFFCDWHGVLSRDPFWVSIRGSAAHPLHARLEAGLAGVFSGDQGIICSSQVAALKAEDPHAFFGPWLATHGMGFADAVLIDDRADNCTAFTGCDGSAIRWEMGTDDISDVTGELRCWLDAAAQAADASAVRPPVK